MKEDEIEEEEERDWGKIEQSREKGEMICIDHYVALFVIF